MKVKTKKRCQWPGEDSLMVQYHDEEWGNPCRDDKKLFEYLILDTFQAGLSWRTILHKRENFRKAFDNFDAMRISKYNKKDVKRLMNDAGIIRNKLKILSAIINAQKFLEMQKEFGSFNKYIWQFTNHKTINNKVLKNIGSTSKESNAISKDMKEKGFKFVGSTICYAFMQGAGIINDHTIKCFRHKEVKCAT
ncbi:MAG: DNA-3-methyladenine glycosylase I [Candidatus Daviesbacteria bacterium]|nr:DNA-3-methyladenine glycosylase I [Candidatus Daviesbacteria bacterium]